MTSLFTSKRYKQAFFRQLDPKPKKTETNAQLVDSDRSSGNQQLADRIVLIDKRKRGCEASFSVGIVKLSGLIGSDDGIVEGGQGKVNTPLPMGVNAKH